MTTEAQSVSAMKPILTGLLPPAAGRAWSRDGIVAAAAAADPRLRISRRVSPVPAGGPAGSSICASLVGSISRATVGRRGIRAVTPAFPALDLRVTGALRGRGMRIRTTLCYGGPTDGNPAIR